MRSKALLVAISLSAIAALSGCIVDFPARVTTCASNDDCADGRTCVDVVNGVGTCSDETDGGAGGNGDGGPACGIPSTNPCPCPNGNDGLQHCQQGNGTTFWGACECTNPDAGPKPTCSESSDCQAGEVCVDEQCRECPGGSSDEICDGADNDCDGQIDEGLFNACGGPCMTLPPPEMCDGLDNDCDGETDEEITCECTDGESRPCAEGSDVGECALGTQRCFGGVWSGACEGAIGPLPELCSDGLDNDCDSTTDDDDRDCQCADGETRECAGNSTGICRPGTQTCNSGSWGACDDVVTPAVESCNGLDDNCNGAADEGFEPEVTGSCGVGACRAERVRVCQGGELVESCTPGNPAPNDASCDGIDSDCDGAVDEDCACVAANYPQPTQCGVGECRSDGELTCVDGQVVVNCSEGAPSNEQCNGLDDNCDGAVDNGIAVQPTSCGVGACERAGQTICRNGNFVDECQPGAATPELCNNIDDDCDGTVDDGFNLGEACNLGVGACNALGTMVCNAAGNGTRCNAVPGQPGMESCNGVDDDCDGQLDDGLPAMPTTCGLGTCERRIQQRCVDGAHGPACVPGEPGVEICDELDNDCDGETDEAEHLGVECVCRDGDLRPCGNDLGECQAGTQRCFGGVWGLCEGGSAPTTEVCDGLDNDCNGEVDEGQPAMPTNCGVGACERAGELTCQNGELVDNCDPGSPGAELCDSVDNDCDGETDEGVLNACGLCGPVPAEVCDPAEIDENCNGAANEGCECAPGAQRPCGSDIGECVPGMQTCVAGAWGACEGGVTPQPEPAVCDGLDNNCDGETDEGLFNGCGQCGPEPDELCNGLDDNCDGATDEGFNLGAFCAAVPEAGCATGVPGIVVCDDAEGFGTLCNGCADRPIPEQDVGCTQSWSGGTQSFTWTFVLVDGQRFWRTKTFVSGGVTECYEVTSRRPDGWPLTARHYSGACGAGGALLFEWRYRYDAEGLQLGYDRYLPGERWRFSCDHVYDAEGLIIETLCYNVNGAVVDRATLAQRHAMPRDSGGSARSVELSFPATPATPPQSRIFDYGCLFE